MTAPLDAVRAWIDDEVDDADAAELQRLLDAGNDAELTDRFSGALTFGTAGLRGPLRAGPNGMNRAVVRRAAAGLAAWLRQQGRVGRPVVIGYDGRHGSARFRGTTPRRSSRPPGSKPGCCPGCCRRHCSPSRCGTRAPPPG